MAKNGKQAYPHRRQEIVLERLVALQDIASKLADQAALAFSEDKESEAIREIRAVGQLAGSAASRLAAPGSGWCLGEFAPAQFVWKRRKE